MTDNFSDKKPSRRQFLAGAAALGAGSSAAGSLSASGDDPLITCLLYTSPSPRDKRQSRMPSSA